MNFDFTLETCCERNQNITFISISACVLINAMFWKCKILEPFKLLTVFLHEFFACVSLLVDGGRVKSIEVNRNHGGCTNTIGGNQFLILPAGYIGSCFYGTFFILMAYINKWTLITSAAFLCFLLLIVLIFYANNFFLRLLCVLFLALTISIWVLCVHFQEDVQYWPLKIIMTFIGVLNQIYSMVDIIEDLITRTVPESDAYKYAEMTKCNSKFCGALWFVVNLVFIFSTVYLIGAIHVKNFDH